MWFQNKLNKYIFPHFLLYFNLKQDHEKQSLVLNRVTVWRPWRLTYTQTALKCPPPRELGPVEGKFRQATWPRTCDISTNELTTNDTKKDRLKRDRNMADGPILGLFSVWVLFSANLLCCYAVLMNHNNGETAVSTATNPLCLGSIGVMFMSCKS